MNLKKLFLVASLALSFGVQAQSVHIGGGIQGLTLNPLASGTVGIGTSAGAVSQTGSGLAIKDINAGIRLQNTGNTGWAYLEFYDESTVGQFIMGYRDSDNSFRILTGTSLGVSTGLVIDNTGAVSFGTPIAVSSGGTGANTAQGGVKNLMTRYAVCISGIPVSAPSDLTEDTLYTCTIPANSIGPNGQINIALGFVFNATANAKTIKVRYSGAAGTVVRSQDLGASSAVWNSLGILIQGANATNAQWVRTSVDGSTANAAVTTAVDSTASSSVVVTCQKAVAGDTCTLKSLLVETTWAP